MVDMDFNFNTQISTTREQSKKLIELGVNEYTADMYFPPNINVAQTKSFLMQTNHLKKYVPISL